MTSRLTDDVSTPIYQAPIRVLKMPKANMAMATPRRVSPDLSLLLNTFLNISLNKFFFARQVGVYLSIYGK